MDVKVKFIFENSDLGSGFEILNPTVVPVKGDLLEFDWESYIADKKQRELIEAFQQKHSFIADILGKSYSLNEVTVTILLRQDTYYEKDESDKLSDIITKAIKKEMKRL